MPSGKIAQPSVEQNPDGTVSIKYQPSEIGLHELEVLYNSQPITGSPFKFHVDAIGGQNLLIGENNNSYLGGYVTAYGPGLSHGLCGEPCEFRIVTKDAGTGGLSVAVEGPSKAEIQCRDNKNGTCDVVYYPTAPGEYQISVKFADKHIFGSPFTTKIGGDARKKNHVLMGGQSDISLKVIEGDVNDLYATIRSPSGLEEPCLLKKLPNGSLGISFTPREVGEHIVSVLRDHKHIKNSPFKIEVRQSEIGDASKVKLYGQGLHEGSSNKINEFIVNTKDAGYGGLSLSIEGPSKADIECHDNEDGSCRVTYKPTEPGTYLLNIKFADKHVPGSPFTVQVDGSGRLTERITRDRKAADTTHIGSICELSLKIPGTSPFDMSAHVQSPSAVIEDCEVIDLDDSNYCIRFVPKEMGIHTVSVKHKDMHIPGSPFEFTVGPIAGGGAHKVRAAGPGLLKGEVNQHVDFNIYTREAGAGALAIAIEGPSKAEIDFQDRKDGTCGVSYVCGEPGEYQVSIKFNDEHIPDSPFTTYISPPIGDAKKITVHSLRTKQVDINKPQTFSVNLNGAIGKIDAKLVSPSGAEEQIIVQDMGDGHYGMRYTPRENGIHWLHIRFNGIDIPESPFRIVVGQVNADPGRVFASGNGLHSGETGKPCEFIIDTLNAGAGALAVTVDGPAKVQLDCKEVQEGYKVSFVPSAPGDYLITIKFVGVNIAGSPFKCKVTGPLLQHRLSTTSNALPIVNSSAREHSNIFFETVEKSVNTAQLQKIQTSMHSDASKVKVKGQGVTKAFRNQKAQFTVDTRDAGNNMLMVGVYGPKAPCEEVVIKHIGNQQYQVTYCVKDKGEYMLIIKYGDQHISGSPFRVEVI